MSSLTSVELVGRYRIILRHRNLYQLQTLSTLAAAISESSRIIEHLNLSQPFFQVPIGRHLSLHSTMCMWCFALVNFTSRQPFSFRLPRHTLIRRRIPGTRSRRRERDRAAGSRWRSPPRCTSRLTSWGDVRTG